MASHSSALISSFGARMARPQEPSPSRPSPAPGASCDSTIASILLPIVAEQGKARFGKPTAQLTAQSLCVRIFTIPVFPVSLPLRLPLRSTMADSSSSLATVVHVIFGLQTEPPAELRQLSTPAQLPLTQGTRLS